MNQLLSLLTHVHSLVSCALSVQRSPYNHKNVRAFAPRSTSTTTTSSSSSSSSSSRSSKLSASTDLYDSVQTVTDPKLFCSESSTSQKIPGSNNDRKHQAGNCNLREQQHRGTTCHALNW
uniref:Uncharacterized protein n=1 Tax=Erythrolobus madagascarensis TaxID=708628 RepID=A0A7S0T5V2_9RHOD